MCAQLLFTIDALLTSTTQIDNVNEMISERTTDRPYTQGTLVSRRLFVVGEAARLRPLAVNDKNSIKYTVCAIMRGCNEFTETSMRAVY